MALLAGRPWAWSLAWGVWMLCALALVGFLAAAAHRLPERRALGALGVILAAAGSAVDLFCDGVQMVVLPQVAQGGPPAAPLFLALERAAGAGGLVAANGLYSVGALLLTLALPPGFVARCLGWATFGAGMVMVVAGLTGDTRLAVLATPPTILLYCAWSAAVAWRLGSRRLAEPLPPQ
jgi:hypothetical protein